MDKIFGWAVIGTGRIANTVMKEIAATGRHRVAAVYSRTKSKAEKFASKFGAAVCGSLKDAVLHDGVDGVYIATPHSVHYPYILECVALGKPVLCEKSFTVNAEQAKAAITAAEQAGVYLSEAMWTRFNPVVKQVCEWVKKGEIGEIKSISANFCLPLRVSRPFVGNRVYKAQYAGGALLDLGVYPVAYAHMLLGVPDKIETVTRIFDEVDYDDKITLTYKNAVCNLNCSFDKLLTYTGKIVGTKGKIVAPMFYKPNRATLVTENGRKTVRCKTGYIYEFDGVAEDIRKGRKENGLIPHNDTVEIMKILDEIRKKGGLRYPDKIEKI